MSRKDRKNERHEVTVHASSRCGAGEVQGGTIHELSVSGCRISPARDGIAVGSDITVSVGSARSISANVKWLRDDAFGVEFERPLHKAELEHLLYFLNEDPSWTYS